MYKTLINVLKLSLQVSMSVTIISCNGDDNPNPRTRVFEPDDYQANSLFVEDLGNTDSSGDIFISFDGANLVDSVLEYRIIIAPEEAQLNLEEAVALTSDQYQEVPNDKNSYSLFLSEGLLDSKGSEIGEGTLYNAFVLSEGSFLDSTVFVLSDPSNEFQLVTNLEVSTLATNIKGNDGISLDVDGNIYVSHYGSYNASTFTGTGTIIEKFDRNGTLTVFASDLISPLGSSFDSDGNFYFINGSNFTSGDLMKISNDGTKTKIATLEGYPAGITIDTEGNLYVSNYFKPVINKVTPAGEVSNFSTDSRLEGCVGIDFDSNGNLITGNFISGAILSLDKDASVSLIATIPTVVQGFVIGYITYFDEHIYATGIRSNIVYKVSMQGEIEEFVGNGTEGTKDGEFTKASFNRPNGIAVDSEKRILYVSEGTEPGNIRMIPLK